MDVIERGDISNEVAPAALLIFEGLVGTLPDTPTRAKHDLEVRLHRWAKAASRWVINQATVGTVWRLPYRVELVTYLPEHEADELRIRLESHGDWPFASFWATTPGDLARMMTYHPSFKVVFDCDRSRWASYPVGKCQMISPANPGQMGMI